MRKVTLIIAIFCVLPAQVLFALFVIPAYAAYTPNDPLYSRQTYLTHIHAADAWSLTTGSEDIVIAVLDSGIDIDHPDLSSAIWQNPAEIPGDKVDNDGNGYVDDIRGWDFINDIPDPRPKFGGDFLYAGIHHGTLIAGIIAARGNNGLGITGISWKSRIMPLRVLTNQGEGTVYDVVRAIDYAIDKKVDIINLSFIGSEESVYLRSALKRALDAGIVVVTASGNNEAGMRGYDLGEKPVYPACFNGSLDGLIRLQREVAEQQQQKALRLGERATSRRQPHTDKKTRKSR